MNAMANPYSPYSPKQSVEVKRRDFSRSGTPQWKAGFVREVTGKGCFVVVNGNASFYNWNDIREVRADDPAKPPVMKAPLTAIARVTDLRDFARLDDEAEQPSPQTLAPVVEAMEPRGSIDRGGNRLRKPHRVTRCGEIFRRIRLNRCISQADVASHLNISDRIVSRIELGDDLPSDDVLLRFAEWSGYDLADLELKRDSDARRYPSKPDPQPKAAPMRDVRPAPRALPPLPNEPVGEALFRQPADFIDFLGVLKSLVPCPTEPANRAKWMQAAEQLWALQQPPS